MASRYLPLSRHSQTDKCKIGIKNYYSYRYTECINKSMRPPSLVPRPSGDEASAHHSIYIVVTSDLTVDCNHCLLVAVCKQDAECMLQTAGGSTALVSDRV